VFETLGSVHRANVIFCIYTRWCESTSIALSTLAW